MGISISEILLIAFGVSIDAAAVSVSGSLCPGKYSKWHCAFNAALFFGGFQFFMPVCGFFAANILTGFVEKFNHYIAFILLLIVGGKMILENLQNDPEKSSSCPLGEFFSPVNLLIPAIATSLDAMAIGAGLAFAGKPIWVPSTAMGVVTALVSILCVFIGKKIADKKHWLSDKLAAIGGIAIILIGVKILLQHLNIIPVF